MPIKSEDGAPPATPDDAIPDPPMSEAQRARIRARCAVDLERLARIAHGLDATEIVDVACGLLARAVPLASASLVVGVPPNTRAYDWTNPNASTENGVVQIDVPMRQRFGTTAGLTVSLAGFPAPGDRQFVEGFMVQLSRILGDAGAEPIPAPALRRTS